MKVLVMKSQTHAHILDKETAKADVQVVKRDLRTTLKYLPYLSVFRDVRWDVDIHITKHDSFAGAKKYVMESLRKQGYTVV